ncbi:MAG TPA: HD domain-containing protein, partial [Planctomycetota bacterium]|nr:HD domain-containing protein [Planctomycetota bacterium]
APEDAATLRSGYEFLTRIRHELHFQAGGPQDVLTRDEQIRIAQWLGYPAEGALLPVERFMQHYYRNTTALQDVVLRFADGARRGSGLQRMLSRLGTRRVGDHYLLSREAVALDPDLPDDTLRRADVLLELFDRARRHRVAVAHESAERARKAVPTCEITPAAREKFLKLMADPVGLGLLGRFIPAFEHARCLMQWNQYHKYTVDEHSIRALEAALVRLTDPGPIGQAYRETRRKDVLHLALLLHDIGKGYEEDHSEVGRRIAEELAALLGLPEHERALLVFLVHKHLIMAHVSQRRDLEDIGTIVQFAREVQTVEALRMLYVLTAADTEAVAPGSLTNWKASLLTDLYSRAMEELTGTSPVADEAAKAASIRSALQDKLRGAFPPDWLRDQLEAMPTSYLRTTDEQDVRAHLGLLREFDPSGVRVGARWLAETKLVEYTVVLRDDLTPGIFSKISGALAAERLQIQAAWIVTRADGVVIDSFFVADPDYAGEPGETRKQDVARTIEDVLLGRRSVEELFAARPVPPPPKRILHASTGGPAQVAVDNATSDRYTVIEVFADDRQGLLYEITHALFEMGLSIASAKISTRLDQVVDVFYVSDRQGGKIPDGEAAERVRRRVLEVVVGKLSAVGDP